MNEFLFYSSSIYLGTCLIWLIVSYIYCYTHYDEFTIKEMIGFGKAWDAADNLLMFFFPLYNTWILLVIGIIQFVVFMCHLLHKIGNIKLK